jgi:4-deoxy-L-threo-5-hexosulose-uronate ketol-isomerase
MEVRYSPDAVRFKRMTTSELRQSFLVELFKKNEIIMTYSHIDRAIIGSAVPEKDSLNLKANKKEMAADYFTQRREIGIINIGAVGTVLVGGNKFQLENKDCLYIGRGKKEIEFNSADEAEPAKFYFVSYPAHKDYDTKLAKTADAQPTHLGSQKEANKRTIYKYIFSDGIKSCQLVMGFTVLDEGNVWNTMAAHTHERRSEIYMYFNLAENDLVCHLMGEPGETRHLIVRNGQAVISPSWSIHSGTGTSNYTFVWSMGGENQEFDDMDFIEMNRLS